MDDLICHRLFSTADTGWAAAFRLYEEAFPPCERRSESGCAAVLRDERFHAESAWIGAQFAGLLFWWQTGGGYAYLEHLAVEPALRGRRCGAHMLHRLCRLTRRVVLEIEPPVDGLTRRRLGFYERNGFCANPYDYIHPSYTMPLQPHRLVVMSSPGPLSPAEFDHFRSFAHRAAACSTGQ